MFTGIIVDIGEVLDIQSKPGGDVRYTIGTKLSMDQVVMGASIACSGVCLTVIDKTVSSFDVEVSQETLNCTAMEQLQVGSHLNLEPALKIGDELGGHIVSGHVDGVAKITNIIAIEGSHKIDIKVPENLAPLIATKGSVTVDGISLTVNDVTDDSFSINIIPHTWTHTTLGERNIDDYVNIEIDMLARYMERMLSFAKK